MTSRQPEPWRVKVVEPIRRIPREQREELTPTRTWRSASYNLLQP